MALGVGPLGPVAGAVVDEGGGVVEGVLLGQLKFVQVVGVRGERFDLGSVLARGHSRKPRARTIAARAKPANRTTSFHSGSFK